MKTAVIEVIFSPPRPDLAGMPGLRDDPGGFIYRVRHTDGALAISGSYGGTHGMAALSRAQTVARRAGFTHWKSAGGGGPAHPLP